MDTTGYVINTLLVLIVLRQMRETRLDMPTLVLPVVLVGVAAAYYLRSVPIAGNDAWLELVCATAGLVLGTLCAVFTVVRRTDDGAALARATAIAAALWIAGIGSRMAFAYGSDHGVGPTIANFSRTHAITSGAAWTAALVIMALAEVLARTTALHLRARAATRMA